MRLAWRTQKSSQEAWAGSHSRSKRLHDGFVALEPLHETAVGDVGLVLQRRPAHGSASILHREAGRDARLRERVGEEVARASHVVRAGGHQRDAARNVVRLAGEGGEDIVRAEQVDGARGDHAREREREISGCRAASSLNFSGVRQRSWVSRMASTSSDEGRPLSTSASPTVPPRKNSKTT